MQIVPNSKCFLLSAFGPKRYLKSFIQRSGDVHVIALQSDFLSLNLQNLIDLMSRVESNDYIYYFICTIQQIVILSNDLDLDLVEFERTGGIS